MVSMDGGVSSPVIEDDDDEGEGIFTTDDAADDWLFVALIVFSSSSVLIPARSVSMSDESWCGVVGVKKEAAELDDRMCSWCCS